MLGRKIGYVLEVEDPVTVGFHGFLRFRVDIDVSRPLLTTFSAPFLTKGTRTFRLNMRILGFSTIIVGVWATFTNADGVFRPEGR